MTWRPDQPIVWEEKTTAPGVTADANNNYLVGDLWIDETADVAYICVDSTAGAAVWKTIFGSAAAILAALITVDGTGSGLDADLLDGSHATAFVTHALATAVSDMLFASGSGAYAKKTLAEGRTLLGLDGATTTVAVGGGTSTAPVWTTATGSGAPVRATSPTLVTPLLGTPTSGDLQNCTIASETTKGVNEFATPTETVAGVSAVLATHPSGVAAAIAVAVNPKAMSQGVALTAAAISPIVVADNTNIRFGIGNLALVWCGSLPTYTPASDVVLLDKEGGWQILGMTIKTTGVIRVYVTGYATVYSSIATGLSNGVYAEIVASIVRETESTPGSVTFYVNGIQLGTTQVLAATSPGSVDSLGYNLFIGGYENQMFSLINNHVYAGNFAPTADEVKEMYRLGGIPESWKWGSQTSLSTGTIVNGIGCTTFDGASATGFHAIYEGGAPGYARVDTPDTISIIAGKKYRAVYNISFASGGPLGYFSVSPIVGGSVVGGSTNQVPVSGLNTYEFTATETATCAVWWGSEGTAPFECTVSAFSIVEIGVTLALEPEGIQPSPGQWLDSSSNKLHAMQPATGSSLTRRMKTFEVRWTNTWAGTHEAQYISGLNQAVLPVGCYITDIIGVVSGATIEDIIIGDGSDTDRWVTITTGLAAGTTAFTIANRISDGTNYKLVVDPDANFTGSIAWTIKGVILQ